MTLDGHPQIPVHLPTFGSAGLEGPGDVAAPPRARHRSAREPLTSQAARARPHRPCSNIVTSGAFTGCSRQRFWCLTTGTGRSSPDARGRPASAIVRAQPPPVPSPGPGSTRESGSLKSHQRITPKPLDGCGCRHRWPEQGAVCPTAALQAAWSRARRGATVSEEGCQPARRGRRIRGKRTWNWNPARHAGAAAGTSAHVPDRGHCHGSLRLRHAVPVLRRREPE
jgi:hypothetical protein